MNKQAVLDKLDAFCRENNIKLHLSGCSCDGRVFIQHGDDVLENTEYDAFEYDFGIDKSEKQELLTIERPESTFSISAVREFLEEKERERRRDEAELAELDKHTDDTENLLVESNLSGDVFGIGAEGDD